MHRVGITRFEVLRGSWRRLSGVIGTAPSLHYRSACGEPQDCANRQQMPDHPEETATLATLSRFMLSYRNDFPTRNRGATLIKFSRRLK
jgi:hypothetical protein